MKKITVVGSFVTDIVAEMEEFPLAGQTVLGKSVGYYPGGKGLNQCIAAARLGGNVEMIGTVGDDANGDMFKRLLKEEGVKADRVFTCDDPTAVAQVQIDKCGQNRICVIPSANYRFGFEELEKIDGALRGTDILLVQLEIRKDVTEAVIRRAHTYGATVILNPAPYGELSPDVFGNIDYITPNETELALLTGIPTDTRKGVEAAVRSLSARGVRHVVATLGARGAMVCDGDAIYCVDGYKVRAVDTVAAGDGFNGALAVGLSEGMSLDAAVRLANATGALIVQTKGAVPSLPHRDKVATLMSV